MTFKGQVGAGKLLLFPSDHDSPPAADSEHIAFEVCGDSLESDDPRTSIFNGDVLVCRTRFTEEEAVKRLCVVRVNRSELLVRKLARCSECVELRPTNPAYPVQRVEPEAVEIIAVVEQFCRSA